MRSLHDWLRFGASARGEISQRRSPPAVAESISVRLFEVEIKIAIG